MGSKKIWTTKDFKEGEIIIHNELGSELLSEIMNECGIDDFPNQKYYWFVNGHLCYDNSIPPSFMNHVVHASEVYLLGKEMKNESKYSHYNNARGSLYLFAKNHDLNAWEFDILKRVVRCRKKGQFKQDLEKTIEVIRLYLEEYEEPERLSDIEGE